MVNFNIMLDIRKAIKQFNEYIRGYDFQEGKIKLKIKHTFGVLKASEYISSKLGLDDENANLAKLIALLHDIGRFEQLRIYNDYRDYKSVDHADLGVEILFEDGIIRSFLADSEYDQIIKVAIKNHNKLSIESNLDDDELLHAKLIRDADKADNFRVKAYEKIEDLLDITESDLAKGKITDTIYDNFLRKELIISKNRVTPMDCWLSYIAFVFDFNFPAGLRYIRDKGLVEKVIQRIDYSDPDTSRKMRHVQNFISNYIDQRLEESSSRTSDENHSKS